MLNYGYKRLSMEVYPTEDALATAAGRMVLGVQPEESLARQRPPEPGVGKPGKEQEIVKEIKIPHFFFLVEDFRAFKANLIRGRWWPCEY
jgi:hypothetical protein